ncbi:hypothetical protein SAMN05892877_113164 [Rhizobium subbaraonis]|uniref:Uncharacterized protein n=1 Tax=Rhizobium subbaraonis TaxID=908946 RepID=A0A285UTC2_9HYPH|nr:hypothetical protein [Rhizobium subbaraonis]SOC44927.1 hypothetical protein SAMN05892877_113164 [Rhizobium subbaraonis]
MAHISPPHQDCTSDRLLECEEALEGPFQQIVWQAMQAGWDEVEVCTAVAMLADHHILASYENQKTVRTGKIGRKRR